MEPSESEMRSWLRAYVDEHLAPEQLTALAARFNDTIVDVDASRLRQNGRGGRRPRLVGVVEF